MRHVLLLTIRYIPKKSLAPFKDDDLAMALLEPYTLLGTYKAIQTTRYDNCLFHAVLLALKGEIAH